MENSANQPSKERLPWNTNDGRVNVIVRQTTQPTFSDRRGYRTYGEDDVRCFVYLDTTNLSKIDLAKEHHFIYDKDGKLCDKNGTPVCASYRGYFSELAKNVPFDNNFDKRFACRETSRLSKDFEQVDDKFYACSVKMTKAGKFNWMTVSKSTIHPDTLSEQDTDTLRDNYVMITSMTECPSLRSRFAKVPEPIVPNDGQHNELSL